MYIRLSRLVDLDLEKLRESGGWFGDQALPELERAPGFQTAFFGADRERGKLAGVTFWESRAALINSEPIEFGLREKFVERGAAEGAHGVVDRYEVALEMPLRGKPGIVRMLRWSGLTHERLSDGHELFEQELAEPLREIPGFCGGMSAINHLGGMVMGLFFWKSPRSMKAGSDWERDTRTQLEAIGTGPHRGVIADTYGAAILPEIGSSPAAGEETPRPASSLAGSPAGGGLI